VSSAVTFGEMFGGNAESGSSAGAPDVRCASSGVPHIPQKRKFSELSSPHFGQITISPDYSCNSLTRRHASARLFDNCPSILKWQRRSPPMPKASHAKAFAAQRFEARLERLRSRLNWIVVHVPLDAAKVWGLRGQIKVKGEINGFAFRTSLFAKRDGGHFLLINKRTQKGARAYEGSVAGFQLELNLEERSVAMPGELKRVLRDDLGRSGRALLLWFDGLNHSTRSDIAKWIAEPKSAAARVRRAEQLAERLLNVMEAERELPPILQVAFARDPKARIGWDLMSASRRRGHLFGIFYYRAPDARGRRIDKMLDDACRLAEKMSDRKKSAL
jgi:uncharacterized protein YdeI (YjbR/CyaY-like superfamily)